MQNDLFSPAPVSRQPAIEVRFPEGWETIMLHNGLEYASGKGVAFREQKLAPLSYMKSADRDALVKSAGLHAPGHICIFPEDVPPFAGKLNDTVLMGWAGEFRYLDQIVRVVPAGKKLALAFVETSMFASDAVEGGPFWYFSESGLAKWMAAWGMVPLGPPGSFGTPRIRMYLKKPQDD